MTRQQRRKAARTLQGSPQFADGYIADGCRRAWRVSFDSDPGDRLVMLATRAVMIWDQWINGYATEESAYKAFDDYLAGYGEDRDAVMARYLARAVIVMIKARTNGMDIKDVMMGILYCTSFCRRFLRAGEIGPKHSTIIDMGPTDDVFPKTDPKDAN